jgi:hypothetical protein
MRIVEAQIYTEEETFATIQGLLRAVLVLISVATGQWLLLTCCEKGLSYPKSKIV